jgi:hypothetical protein
MMPGFHGIDRFGGIHTGPSEDCRSPPFTSPLRLAMAFDIA